MSNLVLNFKQGAYYNLPVGIALDALSVLGTNPSVDVAFFNCVSPTSGLKGNAVWKATIPLEKDPTMYALQGDKTSELAGYVLAKNSSFLVWVAMKFHNCTIGANAAVNITPRDGILLQNTGFMRALNAPDYPGYDYWSFYSMHGDNNLPVNLPNILFNIINPLIYFINDSDYQVYVEAGDNGPSKTITGTDTIWDFFSYDVLPNNPFTLYATATTACRVITPQAPGGVTCLANARTECGKVYIGDQIRLVSTTYNSGRSIEE